MLGNWEGERQAATVREGTRTISVLQTYSVLILLRQMHLPGAGRGPSGKVDVTKDHPSLPPFPNWAPAFAGVVVALSEIDRSL